MGQVKIRDKIIRLSPINMKVLMLLVGNGNQLVSRNQFFDQVWQNQLVNDDTLTRCISDLRQALGEYANVPILIETIPKRGYRWVPQVAEVIPVNSGSTPAVRPGSWKFLLLSGLSGLAALFIMFVAALWFAGQSVRSDSVIVAVLPINFSDPSLQEVATDLEEILQQQLLGTEQIRFLSPNMLAMYQDNPFPYLSREYDTRWIIEGRIRENGDKYRISLSLVDALTATVIYYETENFASSSASLDTFCAKFIAAIEMLTEVN